MMKKYHPDQNTTISHNDAVKKLGQIGKAYKLLGNSDQTMRERYDQSRNIEKHKNRHSINFGITQEIKVNMTDVMDNDATTIESKNFQNRVQAKKTVLNYYGRLYNQGTNPIGFETDSEKQERENAVQQQQAKFQLFSVVSYVTVGLLFGIAAYVLKGSDFGNVENEREAVKYGELTQDDKNIIKALIAISRHENEIGKQDDKQNHKGRR